MNTIYNLTALVVMYKQTFQMLVTEASDKSVQQHPDDFFCWGSLCNTVVSSLGSTF